LFVVDSGSGVDLLAGIAFGSVFDDIALSKMELPSEIYRPSFSSPT